MSQIIELMAEADKLLADLDKKCTTVELDDPRRQEVKVAMIDLRKERLEILAKGRLQLSPNERKRLIAPFEDAIARSRHLLASLPGDPTSGPDV